MWPRRLLAILACGALAGCTTAPWSAEGPENDAPRVFRFLGAPVVGGYPPMGLPAAPLDADAAGRLVARLEFEDPFSGRGVRGNASGWFDYCRPEFGHGPQSDDVLRFWVPDETSADLWYRDRDGAPVTVRDFPPGRAAWATWGDEQKDFANFTLLVVVRLNATDREARGEDPFVHDGFVAVSARGTHFCANVQAASWGGPIAKGRGIAPHLLLDPAHTGEWDPRALRPDYGAERLLAWPPLERG